MGTRTLLPQARQKTYPPSLLCALNPLHKAFEDLILCLDPCGLLLAFFQASCLQDFPVLGVGLPPWALLLSGKLPALLHPMLCQGRKIRDMLEHLAACIAVSPGFQQDFSELIHSVSAFILIYLLLSYHAKIHVFAPVSMISYSSGCNCMVSHTARLCTPVFCLKAAS